MADYKEMHLHLFRETERAIEILIAAQQTCEEKYIEADEQPKAFPVKRKITIL